MGIGDWGLGIWPNTPNPKTQNPNPKPPKKINFLFKNIKIFFF